MFDSSIFIGNSGVLATDDYGYKVTYEEALPRIESIVRKFQEGKQLALLKCENSVECLLHYVALCMHGHSVMLVSNSIPKSTFLDYCDRFDPNFIIHCEDGKVEVEVCENDKGQELYPELGILLSTSGSTGDPKFAKFTYTALKMNAYSIIEYLQITANERPLAHLSMHYSFGISIINSHLLAGAELTLTNYSVMESRFWDRAYKVTSISGVPFHFDMFERLRFFRRDMPHLRMLTQAGGAMPAEQVKRIAQVCEEKGYVFVVMYGQTEAGPRLSYLPAHEVIKCAGSIGRAIPGVVLSITDPETGEEITDDTEGVLIARSPAIMLGYAHNRNDCLVGDTLHGVLNTGDLARRGIKGESDYFVITGRQSRFIKVLGIRTNLAAIEQKMKSCDYQTVCVGEDDALYIVYAEEYDAEKVKAIAIDNFEISPRTITVVKLDVIPRNRNQKPDYRMILKLVKSL